MEIRGVPPNTPRLAREPDTYYVCVISCNDQRASDYTYQSEIASESPTEPTSPGTLLGLSVTDYGP